jgi:hypothetical protein
VDDETLLDGRADQPITRGTEVVLFEAWVWEPDGVTPARYPDVVAEAVSVVFNLTMPVARLSQPWHPAGGQWRVPVAFTSETLVDGPAGRHVGPDFAPYVIEVL